jgi:hypothetical protein
LAPAWRISANKVMVEARRVGSGHTLGNQPCQSHAHLTQRCLQSALVGKLARDHRLRNGTNSADNAVSRRPSAGSSWSPLCYSYSCRCILVPWPTIPGNAPRSVVRSRLQKIDGHPLMPCVEYPLHAWCSTRLSTGQKNDARNAAEAFDLLTRVARVSSGGDISLGPRQPR